MNLTPRQIEVLNLVKQFTEQHGYAPTLQEMATKLGVSTVTVFEHIRALARKGAIRREKHKTRSIEIVEEAEGGLSRLRLLGHIAAGIPIEAVADEQLVDVSELLGTNDSRDLYVLRVRGDSMVEERICDGDYVIVEKRTWANDGETVVALVDGHEATLKKIFDEGPRVRLQPANDAMKPIYVDRESVAIQGVVVGVLRKY